MAREVIPENARSKEEISEKKLKKQQAIEKEDAAREVDEDIIKKHMKKEIQRLTGIVCLIVFITFLVGYLRLTLFAPFVICAYVVWIWQEKTELLNGWFEREHEMREHRRRALNNAETVEWLNYLVNRW